MADKLSINMDSYAEGENAWARGLGVAQLVQQIDATNEDPNEGKDGSEEERTRWAAEQDAREAKSHGLLLGYLNGASMSLRRVENLLTNLKVPG